MSTKTLIWLAVGVTVAVLGGAVIWATTGGESVSPAVLESAEGEGFRLTSPGINGGAPFMVDSYSVGATWKASTTTRAASTDFEPLHFNRPLDPLSVGFFSRAAVGTAEAKVTLELRRIGDSGKPVTALTYEFTQGLYAEGNEAASAGSRAQQEIGLQYQGIALKVPTTNVLGYAGGEESIGRLLISGVADSTKPANLRSYSWGWGRNPDTGKFSLKALSVTRTLDSHGPWFWQQVMTGKLIPEVILELETLSTGEKPSPYATYRMTDVQVTAVNDAGGEPPMQQIEFEFSKIALMHGTAQTLYDAPTTK